MPSLPEMQVVFGDALRSYAAAHPPALWTLFREPEAIAERRLAAYRRNVVGSWRSALASTYPVLAQLLGGQRFRVLADEYSAAFPSDCGDLNVFGRTLAEHLDASPLGLELPYLPDMARLEWALLVAYGAADGAVFDFEALSAVPAAEQASLHFRVWDGAALVLSNWPLVDIWQAHQLERGERDAVLARIEVACPEACRALVARHEGRAYVIALNSGEAVFLLALRAGLSLNEALVKALDEMDGFNPGVALHRLISTRTLTGFFRHDEAPLDVAEIT